jgi:Lysozyme like domain
MEGGNSGMTVQYLGTQVQGRKLTELAYSTGLFNAIDLVKAVAICLASTEGYDKAKRDNPDGSRNCGLWFIKINKDQIGQPCEALLYDDENNAQTMYDMFTDHGWEYWEDFNSKKYLQDTYLQRACLGCQNFIAELMVNDAKKANQTPITRVPMVTIRELQAIYKGKVKY